METTEQEFEELVAVALDGIPPELAELMDNVVVLIEAEPPADDPDLLGLYDGIPLTEGGSGPGDLPNRIAIYRLPLEADFPDDGELREEIRVTVLHELGHYFGLDEDRLSELGYE